ncbi:MAG: hypothetical protein JWM95_2986 [Gemmatimonadetes bacterium]|nr:hypothetical protein [Gemmatimonadota bacterium]
MIALRAVCARAGTFELRDVTADIPRGAWGIILGPAGSGKTTLLETIAGVRKASGGTVALRGVDVTTLPPERRGVGIVYQHGYLFPHMSVEENIAYGTTNVQAALDTAARFGVDQFAARSVSSLSGGERQLVSLARALAPCPDILLLDEPFAALDPRRRARLRVDLRRLLRERGTTVLHVTHDFTEAGTLGDIAMVLEGGRVSQVGAPETLFRQPASAAVADFLGAENVLSGTISLCESGGDGAPGTLQFTGDGVTLIGMGDRAAGTGHAVIRGEDIVLAREWPVSSSARNVLRGTIVEVARDGVLSRVTVAMGAGTIVAVVTHASAMELGLAPGEAIVASIKATAVHVC